jgi:dUTP pyrophosphatase
MSSINVKVINQSKHALPNYETVNSAGMDVRANIDNPILLNPGDRALVKTGLLLEIPSGFECQVRPRSGLALKKGLTVLNTPGTIDADYRGEVGVILINLSQDEVTIEDGERIAQLVFTKFEQATWMESKELSETERGAGGFGSTGVK